MGKALKCEMCGAPMKNRRECEYCGMLYYTGPEVPEREYLYPHIVRDMYSSSYAYSTSFIHSNTCWIGV